MAFKQWVLVLVLDLGVSQTHLNVFAYVTVSVSFHLMIIACKLQSNLQHNKNKWISIPTSYRFHFIFLSIFIEKILIFIKQQMVQQKAKQQSICSLLHPLRLSLMLFCISILLPTSKHTDRHMSRRNCRCSWSAPAC